MKVRVIDFEVLTSKYKNYVDGIDEINKFKEEFLRKIDPIKEELNDLIKFTSSNLIVDRQAQMQKGERFQKLQAEAVKMDGDFKAEIKNMYDKLNLSTFSELSVIINDWASSNDIDLVSSKMEVVYCKPDFDSTEDIIDILKSKGLYSE